MSHKTAVILNGVLVLCLVVVLAGCSSAAAPPMSLAEAQQIASQSSECMQVARTTPKGVYNPSTNTWTIDLDATARGCNPACVVDVASKTAHVDWRCVGSATPPQLITPTPSQMANPASENCVKQGGTVSIQTRGDGGQYGVCMFEDNRQCEEWAMLRGECPVGGIKVTGYTTPAAQYCAITGGTYTMTSGGNTAGETGTCTFKDGSTCDANDYYNGKCTPGMTSVTPTATAAADIQPLSMEVCDGEAQAMAHTLNITEVTQSIAPLSDPVNGKSGTGCQSLATGTGAQYQSPDAVNKALGTMLTEEGWTEDPMLAAGGPTGIGSGYRKDDQLCLTSALWQPDASANCPSDQPISACNVKPEQQLYTITLNCGVETAAQ
jgi:putative hemolysin